MRLRSAVADDPPSASQMIRGSGRGVAATRRARGPIRLGVARAARRVSRRRRRRDPRTTRDRDVPQARYEAWAAKVHRELNQPPKAPGQKRARDAAPPPDASDDEDVVYAGTTGGDAAAAARAAAADVVDLTAADSGENASPAKRRRARPLATYDDDADAPAPAPWRRENTPPKGLLKDESTPRPRMRVAFADDPGAEPRKSADALAAPDARRKAAQRRILGARMDRAIWDASSEPRGDAFEMPCL